MAAPASLVNWNAVHAEDGGAFLKEKLLDYVERQSAPRRTDFLHRACCCPPCVPQFAVFKANRVAA